MSFVRAAVLTLLLVAQPWAGLGALTALVRIAAAGDSVVVICTGTGVRLLHIDGDGGTAGDEVLVCPTVAAFLLDGVARPEVPPPAWRPLGRIPAEERGHQAALRLVDAPSARGPPILRESS